MPVPPAASRHFYEQTMRQNPLAEALSFSPSTPGLYS
jgi:hypothetical protein